jgi:magnesium transporter
MIVAFVPSSSGPAGSGLASSGLERREIGAADPLPPGSVWLDLYQPGVEERAKVDAAYGLALPTLDEMRAIEPSARYYVENGAVYMTVTVLARADDPVPAADAFTFVLANRALVTVRHNDPRPVHVFAQKIQRNLACATGEEALLGLIESFVDRLADILERIGVDLDALSRSIFLVRGKAARQTQQERDLQQVLRDLGRLDDLCSTARESMLGLQRLASFLASALEGDGKKQTKEFKTRVKSIARDVVSLMEHADYDSHKVNFLLDATLGQINIEQNRIIKLFSVVSVVLMPPTLVGTVYGMNFRDMPELDWSFGYPMAICAMLASAVLPYLYFKRRGWF